LSNKGIPTKTIKSIPKFEPEVKGEYFHPKIAGTAIEEIHEIIELLLNSHDRPAIFAVLSICEKLSTMDANKD